MSIFNHLRRFWTVASLFLIAAFAVALTSTTSVLADEPEYQTISDIVYKKVGDREIKLNLYLPLKDGQIEKGRPLLIYLDSGCWYSGDPGNGGIWTGLGARGRRFAIASVSHRPISESAFPTPMEDVRAAVRFLRKHAEEYGYDPERFAVCGSSSGGHLSLTLGIAPGKSPFDVGENLDVSGQVQRVIDYYGPADLEDVFVRYPVQAIDCIYAAFAAPREAGDVNHPDHAALLENAKKYSPITYVDRDYAPTLILHGTMDTIVPFSQSALMYEKLQIHGVRSQFIVSDGGVHDPVSLGSGNMMAREIFEFLQWL